MELEGKIYKVMEPMSGVSQKTGNAWMSQEFILQYYWFPNQTMPSYMAFSVFGEERLKQFDLHENDEIKMRFNIEAHESNGRWFNQVRCTAVDKKYAAQSSGYEPKGILAQKAAEEAAKEAAAQANEAPEPDPLTKDPKDDLPF